MIVATLLVLTAFVAGLIDAMAGGGGLLTVPALALAGLDPVTVVATNKLQSTFGSGTAAFAFWRAGRIDLRAMAGVPVMSAAGSVAGALAVTHIPRDAAMGALPVLLLGVALYFLLAPPVTEMDRRPRLSRPAFLLTVVPAIGFYDGVFGPGTGSFFTIAFVTLLGFGLIKATAHTKLANLASNVAALATLALSGHVLWGLGLMMGVGQLLGARVGVWLALRHGARLVRPLLVTVCCILALRLAFDPANPLGALLRR